MFNNPSIREYGIDPKTKRMRYILIEPLIFELSTQESSFKHTTSTYVPNGMKYIVPKDYITDLASTPSLIWFLFPPNGRYSRAAILHDYLYSKKGKCSRFLADAIFREGMKILRVPAWKRLLMFYAVRFMGIFYYQKA